MALVSVQLPADVVEGRVSQDKLSADACMSVSAPSASKPLEVPLMPAQHNMQARKVSVWEWQGMGLDEGYEAARWFSGVLGFDCRLVRYVGKSRMPSAAYLPAFAGLDGQITTRPTDPDYAAGFETSFADDFPILLVSEEDLSDLNVHLQQRGAPPVTMARFRPNLVMKGGSAWAEDTCRTVSVQTVDNGSVELTSVKPCSRCKVPTIDPETAEAGDEPLDTLHTFRNGGSLGWSKKSWKHAVFFGTNLVVPPEACGHLLHAGDHVEMSGTQVPW
ncbi:MOSC domain-containing protein [Dunaliella salina]|uniref:MOSC domain-containing protein n=1 Tax=Dunaliella salina TaxID=3046 RepID=A0ABQ7GW88_DUNSA|nr:MOSC domain-containing protein [Dunaliella salina]|eukprot:KAF5838866.1 MOSC domain-containing protein [Dunaliella salina]